MGLPTTVGRRAVLHGGLAMLGLAIACPCCPSPAQAIAFNYGDNGPSKWGGTCSVGRLQSPVDLLSPSSRTAEWGPGGSQPAQAAPAGWANIDFNYKEREQVSILNTGHGTMQVNFQPGNLATVGDRELELVQYHFHSPSEHAIDGKRFPMEVHLVHKVKGGGFAVVAVFLDTGGVVDNPGLQLALSYAPVEHEQENKINRPLNPKTLLPRTKDGRRPYVHYVGSLTTPPCTEYVDWYVMTDHVKVTDKQVVDFMLYVGDAKTLAQNSRPIQASIQASNARKYEVE